MEQWITKSMNCSYEGKMREKGQEDNLRVKRWPESGEDIGAFRLFVSHGFV